MNIVVNSQVLATELRLLNRVVPSKPAIAILGHVRLRGDAEGLHLYATDMEVGLSSSCPASVDVTGEVALPVDVAVGLCCRVVLSVPIRLRQ